MPATEIPPRSPVPAPPSATSPGSDLYDAGSWETAYTEMHDVPALLIQLQDDLSRSRQREAFWISVVVHLAIVILVVNSARLEGLMHRRSVILVRPQDLMKQKDLTYLELPPDEQKLTKRPDTNKISDKDRIATSKAPPLDRKELKKILDSARPGPPGPPAQNSHRHRHLLIRTRWPACRLPPRNGPRRASIPAQCRRDRQLNKPPAPPPPIAVDTVAIAGTMAWVRGSKAARRLARWTS